MTIQFCVLNLTKPARGNRPELNIGNLSLGDETVPIASAREIPTDRGPLVLYIVGHAVQDALLVPTGDAIADDEIIATIMKRRGNHPTLIIWDFCFARSFERVNNRGWANRPYLHIFSCQAHEQAWHVGRDPEHPFRTLFSLALQKVVDEGIEDWFDLKDKLQGLLGQVQHPSIRLPLFRTHFWLKPRRAGNVSQLRPTKKAAGRQKKAAGASKQRQPKRGKRSAARPRSTAGGSKRRRRG